MAADLDAIAAELLALPPDEFTAARNARAAGAAGDLATAIRALRKPTVAAWAVDLLAREGHLTEALELAEALREAQGDLDAAELARLSSQRRALVASLARQAADLAADRGVTVSAAARDDVEKTLNAAMMDAAASAAVMTARLVRPLEATGFDPVDLTGAVAGSDGVASPPVARRDDLAERRARRAAEQAARDADRAAAEAERELARASARASKALERVDHVAERLDDVRAELARLEGDARSAAEESRRADAEREEAAARATHARRRATAAATALDDLARR